MHRTLLAVAVVVLAACDQSPVEWQQPRPLSLARASEGVLVFDGSGGLATRAPPPFATPVFPSLCAGSVRVGRDTTGAWYAAWWSVRADSTADLVVSYSADGRSWAAPATVDTMDVGATGCRRPPPSIYVDGDNVHVAYAMAAREGPGIFASHSMDRGTMFHSPVPVVYGERIGLTAIAARGNTVAVAYEDPNSDPRRVAVALSRTLGHIFEDREIVSPPTGPAHGPGVAVGDGVVAVTWYRGSGDSTLGGSEMVREGRIR